MRKISELARYKHQAHLHIDRLWKDGLFTRTEVYKLLEISFGKPIHIRDADIELCKRVIKKLSVGYIKANQIKSPSNKRS